MIQKGGLQVMAPVPAALVEEDDSDRVLNLWRGLLFKTSDDLASRNPSPHRDELIRILNEIIKRNNAHEIQTRRYPCSHALACGALIIWLLPI